MKYWYQSLSLKTKQILIIIAINAFSLSIASTLYFFNNLNSYKKDVINQLQSTSQIIAGNITSSLLFQDKHAAQEQLKTLVKDKGTLFVGIYDVEKIFFANYEGEEYYRRPDFSQYSPGIFTDGDITTVVNEIYYDQELLGYILIVKDSQAATAQIKDYTLITLAVFVMSLLFAWFLSNFMQRWLTKPIQDFAQTIQNITSNKDYSQRLSSDNKDEIGTLMESFNDMLDAVEERDAKLQAHGEELEDLVSLRTRQLHQRSNYDALTKLPNRHFLIEQLEHQIAISTQEQSKIAILFMDLDRFKIINDNLGHAIGDQVLKVVAKRLEKLLRNGEIIARWGGDEFIIVLPNASSKTMVEGTVANIISSIEQEIQLAERQFHISTCIGISLFPNNGKDPLTLLKHADASMYKAKSRGAGSHTFYNSEMENITVDRISMETKLRRALENNLLTMVYQPKVDIQKGELSGVEALIRWEDDELGQVPPSQFIPLAEEIGLINKIGEFVIHNTCEQHAKWRSLGMPPVRIAINLSPTHLSDPKVVEQILQEMDFYQIEPDYLELEITEETFLDSSEQCKKNLTLFNKFGIHISIDDFGTGYSCLSYLLELPVTTLKIDGSFVRKLGTQPENDGIVNAIMTLGHGLGLKVVAECVETREQLDFLYENGCNIIQGYYFSKPLAADDVPEYVKASDYLEPCKELESA